MSLIRLNRYTGPAAVDSIALKPDGHVQIIVEIDPERLHDYERCRIEAEQAVRSVQGVSEVSIILTAETSPAANAAPVPQSAKGVSTRRIRKGAQMAASAQPALTSTRSELQPIDGIDRIIAVTSAKGGVGKSTIAVNLAVALSKLGLRVGLLDADVYGPSVPTMVGTVEEKPETNAEKKLIPIERFGVKTMSIGYVAM